MFLKKQIIESTRNFSHSIKQLSQSLLVADAIIIGAGAGMSTSAGFDKHRLFYTQGDYGLWQCSKPCHQKTYDNETIVRQMVKQQRDMLVPAHLVPYCPICGAPMSMNLRADNTFIEDEGWHMAANRVIFFSLIDVLGYR